MSETRSPHHELTPAEIVAALDKYIIGQDAAKRAVALAIRDRWRRQQLDDEMRGEVIPKNIIMIGPTGIGKTEISRRIATLTDAPFIKVEASKFTEVGYVGRDVESMIRDLTELAINMVTAEATARVEAQAAEAAEEQLLDILLPPIRATGADAEGEIEVAGPCFPLLPCCFHVHSPPAPATARRCSHRCHHIHAHPCRTADSRGKKTGNGISGSRF